MTSPVEEIIIRCPLCNRIYRDWWRPSMNLALDNFDEDYIRKASTATCPNCGYKIDLSVLIVDREGIFHV